MFFSFWPGACSGGPTIQSIGGGDGLRGCGEAKYFWTASRSCSLCFSCCSIWFRICWWVADKFGSNLVSNVDFGSNFRPLEKLRGCGRGSGEGGNMPDEGPKPAEEKIGLGIKGGKPLDENGKGDVKGIDEGDRLLNCSGFGEAVKWNWCLRWKWLRHSSIGPENIKSYRISPNCKYLIGAWMQDIV